MSAPVNHRHRSAPLRGRVTRRATVAVALGVLTLAGLVAGCGPGPDDGPTTGLPSAELPPEGDLAAFVVMNGYDDLGRGTVRVLDGEGGVRLAVAVVIADSPAARSRGLQGIAQLPAGIGMLFAFPDLPPGERRPGFWMLGTALPLDIAFVADGTVVATATMAPCSVRPCPITHPDVAYDVALEVVAGALAAAGVVPGDRFESIPAGYG
jgi:uncharacterized membrane protein (UPF0127 family)